MMASPDGRPVAFDVPIPWHKTCVKCAGSGWTGTKRCVHCQGRGEISVAGGK